MTSPDTNFGSSKNAQGCERKNWRRFKPCLRCRGRSFSDRTPWIEFTASNLVSQLLVGVYQLILALKAPNLGIIVCADRAVRRLLYTHKTIGRSFGIGYIMVVGTKTCRSHLCFRCCFATLSFTKML